MSDNMDGSDRREREERLAALDRYRLDHHAAYREHTARRQAASESGRDEAARLFPGVGEIRKAHKHARLHLKRWDNANPSPMTWDEYNRLGDEFDAR